MKERETELFKVLDKKEKETHFIIAHRLRRLLLGVVFLNITFGL